MVVFFAELLGLSLAALGPRGRAFLAWTIAVVGFDVIRLRRALVLRNIVRAQLCVLKLVGRRWPISS